VGRAGEAFRNPACMHISRARAPRGYKALSLRGDMDLRPWTNKARGRGATKPSRCVGARTRQAWTRRARPHCVANTEKAESKNETPAPQANRRANRKKMPRRRILFDGGASGYFEMVVSFWMVWDCPPGPVTVLSLDQVLVEASQLPVVLVFTDLLRGPVVVELRL